MVLAYLLLPSCELINYNILYSFFFGYCYYIGFAFIQLKHDGVASLLGLNVTGTLGILLIGKKLGFVEEIKPLMDTMIKYNRYINQELYLAVLRKAEEI